MNAKATDSRSAAEIEREVQQSRADIEHTLDAIQERLSPGQLVDQTLGYFRGGRGADFARNLGDSIAQNPMPVALMGVGLAWMMFGQRPARDEGPAGSAYWDEDLDPVEEHYAGFVEEDTYPSPEADPGVGYGEGLKETGSTAKDRMGQVGEQAGEKARQAGDKARHAGEQARHAAAQARERLGRAGSGVAARAHGARAQAGYYGRRARQGMLRSLDEQPLVLGAIGLAIGAALGAALPPTETEDDLMGEARDNALRRATKVGRDQVEHVREAAGAVATAAREEAGRHASTSKSSGEAREEPGGQGWTPKTPGEPGGGIPGQSTKAAESRRAGSTGDPPFPADPKARLDRP